MPTSTTLNAREQLLLELTNRARLDPTGEAERFGIGLNDDLNPGTIGNAAMQVLAPNAFLEQSSENHSNWMLNTNQFQHTGANNTNAGERMELAGYDFTTDWAWAENLAWSGTTGTINLQDAILDHHEGLFRSSDHRVNTLNDAFREVGISQVRGTFTSQGFDYDSSMTTLNFGRNGSNVFLTGVAYMDTNGNDFYDIGEGRGDVTFSVGTQDIDTAAAGGYGIAVAGNSGATTVDIQHGTNTSTVSVTVGAYNVKLDVVDNDTLFTDGSVNLVSGAITNIEVLGENNVTLGGNTFDNSFEGGRGNDTLNGNGGHDELHGEDGADALNGGTGNDILYGGRGGDTINGGSGNDNAWGDNGNDSIYGGFGDDRLHGNDGNDLMMGGGGADQMFGGAGNDVMEGNNDDDLLRGHAGDDLIRGGDGNDQLEGQSGNDVFYGGDGNDMIEGHVGRDVLNGGAGDDALYGGVWVDQLYGGTGNDALYGGQSNDRMWGNDGTDTLYGGTGRDRLHGNNDNDMLYGGDNNDQLFGGNGMDQLYGGTGDDRLDGSHGDDQLTGGDGADTFVFKINQGNDTVLDFASGTDYLLVNFGMFDQGTTSQDIVNDHTSLVNGNLVITTDSDQTITLEGVTSITEFDIGFPFT